jgi:glutamine synthetase
VIRCQEECYKIGIPLITRHREVAPNQYEFAPMFGNVIGQIDNNLMVMQICEEVCAKHGLVALMQEKPFANINGSGKHNNWSLSTMEGAQLFNPTNLTSKTGCAELFPVVMACMVAGIDKYGDLMRMAIATPGNDFRLGGMEAPPAVISTYLGEDMTNYLNEFVAGNIKPYVPGSSEIDLGVDILPKLTAPAEDRNRTSPFPYGGARFEFRAVGSSQNVSLVNTVLNTMIAEEFNNLCDKVDAGAKPVEVAQAMLKDHMKAVFNGDGYSAEWLPEAEKRGLFVIPTQPDAIRRFSVQKNVDLFANNGVFTPEECAARENVLLTAYTGTVEMEALCMIDMMNQHVIPAMKSAGLATAELDAGVSQLKKGLKAIHDSDDDSKAADLARELRLETMIAVRKTCDDAEAVCPAGLWTLATYKELLFNDPTMGEMLYTA